MRDGTRISKEERMERASMPSNVRRLKGRLPTDDWLAIYALFNYMDIHEESMKAHLTSAKKTRTFMTSLLSMLLTDDVMREAFLENGGFVDLRVDSDGKVMPRGMEGDESVNEMKEDECLD